MVSVKALIHRVPACALMSKGAVWEIAWHLQRTHAKHSRAHKIRHDFLLGLSMMAAMRTMAMQNFTEDVFAGAFASGMRV